MIRIFDLVFSLTALLFLFPLLFIVSIILLCNYENKIFYLQTRIGKNKKKIKIIKFATMLENSPNIGSGTITLKDDPRVFPIGKILRKFKINELPQLLNVVKGDMSLVGPRPLTIDGFNIYSLEAQKNISKVLPGLSGIGSLYFRNEEILLHDTLNINLIYKKLIMPYKESLEIWFYNNQSLKNLFQNYFLYNFEVIKPGALDFFKFFPNLPTPSSELTKLFKTIENEKKNEGHCCWDRFDWNKAHK